MTGDRFELEVGALEDTGNDRFGDRDGQSKLRLAEARRDVRMRLCVDIWVDAQADGQRTTELLRHAFDDVELLDVLDVQCANAGLGGRHDFLASLSDSAVHDPIGRETCLQGALHLPHGNDVRTAALCSQAGENRQIAIGLDGVCDEVRSKRERFVDRAVRLIDGRARVNKRGRIELLGDRLQRHVFADERARSIREPRRLWNVNVGHVRRYASRRACSRPRSSAMAAATRPRAGPPTTSRRSTAVCMSKA